MVVSSHSSIIRALICVLLGYIMLARLAGKKTTLAYLAIRKIQRK
jgi:hypothetical protein